MKYLILTPGGYLIGRFEGTKIQAEKWAGDHYLVFNIVIDEDKNS